MGLKKGQELDVTITDIAFGGRGLVRVDGMVVFVDQAVPQDRVKVRIFKKKKQFAEARIIELIDASGDRVEAPCPYSGYCGGCKWQFLAYDKQLAYKQQHVSDALIRIGGLSEIEVAPTIAAEKVFGYRNKMEFTCSPWRWLMPHELGQPDIPRGMALGLHVPGTFNKVLDTRACLLQPDTGNALMAEVREAIQQSDRPIYDLKTHKGFWRFLVLRHSVAEDSWMVNIITADADPPVLEPLTRRLLTRHAGVAAIINNVTARKAGVAVGEREYLLAGKETITDAIGPYRFQISANSFFQTNTRGAARLYALVAQFAGLSGSETVVDLYSGTGTIAIYLAADARQVTGFELSEVATADAHSNCRLNQISNCRFVAGDVREKLGALETAPDVMIIDPPRSVLYTYHAIRLRWPGIWR